MTFKTLIPMYLRYRLMELRGRDIYSGYPDKSKCIFIHIPKTAGTSVARALFDMGSRHVPYMEYERANSRKFKKYFKFAFVRNPWDRLVSTFLFLKRGGLNDMDKSWADEHLSSYTDFEEFVRTWLTETNIWSWVHFKPQHYFISDKDFRIKVDFVGRMESLQTDFDYIAKRLGCHRQLENYNVSKRRSYQTYYSEETRAIVEKVYHADIHLFNYSFELKSQKDVVVL